MIKLANYTVEIANNVLENLDLLKQNSSKSHEAGGVLLGYIIEETQYIRITKISTPCEEDISSPTSFQRDGKSTQKIIDREFNESNGKIIYLGEWHTHYEKKPIPSGIDISMIRKHHKASILNQDLLLLLIKGTKDIFISTYDGKRFISDYYN